MASQRRSAAFTLIELMIVVAIIGVLAATAIPSFRHFQLRSKSSEAKVNLAAIRSAELAVVAEFGNFVAAATSPPSYGGERAIPFTDAGPPGANFRSLGFAPEGVVYFSYSVAVAGTAFTAEAGADIDADGTPQLWSYVLPDVNGAKATPVMGCTGVFDASSGTSSLTNTIGPCASGHGLSIF